MQNSQDSDLVESGEKESRQQLVDKYLELAIREVEVRQTEILVRRDDLQNQKEIALRSIDAQAKDFEQNRETFGKESSKHKWFSAFMLVAVMAFVLLLVFQGETQFAERLISLLGGAILGAFGGYGYAMKKANPMQNNLDS